MAITLREKTLQRAETGRNIAAAIHDAVLAELPSDANLLTVLAHRILRCNSEENHWLGTDLHNEHGEAFDGGGRFWNCGSKLCESCLAKASRRNRKILSAIINHQKLLVGQHYHFMTLTMPTQDLTLLQARSIMNYAWTLFRKKDWFKKTFIGGCKSEEFTLNKKGYHYHMHFIAVGKWVNYNSMRHFWTEALRVAFIRNGLSLSCATTDGLAIANIRKIGSITDAVREVAKYITKSSSWRKLKAIDLLDAARIERWPRMFEFFGSFRIPSCGVAVPEVEDSLNKTILDTKQLSDGDPEQGWRARCRQLGAERYLSELHQQITDQSDFRMKQLKFHYTAARFRRLKQTIPPNIEIELTRIKTVDIRRSGTPFVSNHYAPNGKGGLVDVSTGRVIDYFDGYNENSLRELRQFEKQKDRPRNNSIRSSINR